MSGQTGEGQLKRTMDNRGRGTMLNARNRDGWDKQVVSNNQTVVNKKCPRVSQLIINGQEAATSKQ